MSCSASIEPVLACYADPYRQCQLDENEDERQSLSGTFDEKFVTFHAKDL